LLFLNNSINVELYRINVLFGVIRKFDVCILGPIFKCCFILFLISVWAKCYSIDENQHIGPAWIQQPIILNH